MWPQQGSINTNFPIYAFDNCNEDTSLTSTIDIVSDLLQFEFIAYNISNSVSGNVWDANYKINDAGNDWVLGLSSSAEIYGFTMTDANSDGVLDSLSVTTTNQGQDNISSATYAGFDDVIFAASGFTFSLSNGELIATI